MKVHPGVLGPSLGPLRPPSPPRPWSLAEPGDIEKGEQCGRPERILRGTIEARPLGARGGTDRGGPGQTRTGMAAGAADAGRGVAIPVELRRERRLVCVEYPGLVRDVSKMLSTLGGEEGVSRVRKGESPGPREGPSCEIKAGGAGPPGGKGVVS